MPRTLHGSFVHRPTVWAMVAVVACVAGAQCQQLTVDPRGSQLLASTDGTFAEKAVKLGNAYLSGHGVSKDEKQAAYWYEKAAGAGDPEAQQQIGYFYQAGIGVPVDPVRAAHWYQLAAASGLATAKRNLGVAYMWGAGVPMDKAFAAKLFREAADKGDGPAASYLGSLYYLGQGVPQDKSEAERWYRAGAKLHDPVAYYDLGALFSTDKDHAHDPARAAEWLRMSVAGGYVPAMLALGLLIAEHPELGHSNHDALSLLEGASGYGQWKASEALGMIHRNGRVVPRDPKAAYYYFHLAILQGGEPLKQRLEADMRILSAELGGEQAAKLDAEAQGWYNAHHDAVEYVLRKTVRNSPPGLAIVTPAAGLHAGQLITVPPS
jgi:uncharacterized protein